MCELEFFYNNGSRKFTIFEKDKRDEPGYYVTLGEDSETANELIYAKNLAFSFYIEVINCDSILKRIDTTHEIRSGNREELRYSLKMWYLVGLLHHFREQQMVIGVYFEAIESLWSLFEEGISELKEGKLRERSIQMLLRVHTDPGFKHSDVSSDEQERRVYMIVFEQGSDLSIRKELERPHRLDAQRWFLDRYDTKRARIMSATLEKKEDIDQNTEDDRLKALQKADSFHWLGMILVLVLSAIAAYLFLDYFFKFFDAPALPKEVPLIYSIIFGFGLYILPLLWIIWNMKRKGVLWYQIMLPRLLCGIILGYILLMSTEAWAGSQVLTKNNLSQAEGIFLAVLRVILPLALCFGYLYIEINNNIKGSQTISRFSLRRTCSILCQGIFYSLFVGVIFSDLFGKVLVNELKAENLYHLPGPVGTLYPISILMLAPLALFIGIFTQIIWEDKAITHPI